MKLQPIESAPKDGRDIILFDYDFWIGYWSPSRERWSAPEGWGVCCPTHWCTLPALEDDAELQSVKAERDSLRTALIETAECLACWVGDSPDHEASQRVLSRAKKALNPTPEESSVDGRES